MNAFISANILQYIFIWMMRMKTTKIPFLSTYDMNFWRSISWLIMEKSHFLFFSLHHTMYILFAEFLYTFYSPSVFLSFSPFLGSCLVKCNDTNAITFSLYSRIPTETYPHKIHTLNFLLLSSIQTIDISAFEPSYYWIFARRCNSSEFFFFLFVRFAFDICVQIMTVIDWTINNVICWQRIHWLIMA